MGATGKADRFGDLIAPGGLPAEVYTDVDQLAAERTKVLNRTWQFAGYISDLSDTGSYITTTCGTEPVILARMHDGSIRAISNVCRHRGGPVAIGQGRAKSLRCVYHGWRYDLSGRVLTNTARAEGLETQLPQLPVFSVAAVPPFVFVRVEGGHGADVEVFHDMQKDLEAAGYTSERHRHRCEYRIKANWKIVMENFLKCVHCPYVHPNSLGKSLDLDTYQFDIRKNFVRFSLRSLNQESLATVIGGTSTERAEPRVERQIYAFYPNFAVSLLRGLLVTFYVVPVDTNTSHVIRDFLVTGKSELEPTAREIVDIRNYFNHILQEDIRVVEAVQRNMASQFYCPGGYLPGEVPVKFFHESLERDLQLNTPDL